MGEGVGGRREKVTCEMGDGRQWGGREYPPPPCPPLIACLTCTFSSFTSVSSNPFRKVIRRIGVDMIVSLHFICEECCTYHEWQFDWNLPSCAEWINHGRTVDWDFGRAECVVLHVIGIGDVVFYCWWSNAHFVELLCNPHNKRRPYRPLLIVTNACNWWGQRCLFIVNKYIA